MLNVGDAVMSFLGDTTNLDQAFSRIVDGADKAMSAASDSVGDFTEVLNNSRSDVDAWNETLVSAMHDAGDAGKEAGEEVASGMEKARSTTYEARGEAALLGEAFGIHLPRHVRSFVAELPGIGTALSAAFAATAVLFLIEALVKGVDKIQEWAQEAHKTALAWDEFNTAVAQSFRGLDDKLLQSGIKMDELKGDHVDALRKQLELIDHVSMNELEQQFNLLAKAADAMFSQLNASWYQLDAGSKGAKNALIDFKAQYDLLLAEGKNKDAADLLSGTAKSAQTALDTMKAAKKEAEEVAKLSAETAGAEPSPVGGPTEKELQAQEALVLALNAQIEAQKKINELAADDTFIKRSEDGKRAAEEQAAEDKRLLDQQLANIETWKAQQHAAYEAGKIDAAAWRVAELQATDAATIAHESYLQKLISLYTRSGQAAKAHSAAEELVTLQTKDAAKATEDLAAATEKHRAAVAKVRVEYDKLVEAGVTKDFEDTAKAAQKLTAADEDLAKAESALAEDKLTQKYKDQETAITKLAQMHLITESQKDDRLKVLEQQQATEAIAILNKQLATEEKDIAEAAAKIAAMKLSPSVSNAEVLEAEANLDKLKAKLAATESEIVQTHEKFNKESEADDKNHYGRALLLAMSFGAEMLAEQLKQNHADILAEENQLKQAKARGENTAAIEKQIEAMKLHEKQLEQEANGNKQLILEEQKVTQVKLLAAQANLQLAKDGGLNTLAIEKEIRDLQLLLKAQQQEVQELPRMKTAMQGVTMASEKLGDMLKNTAQEMDNAFASAIMGALASGKSIGQAMEQATATVLKNLATQALAHAIYCTAMGIAELATGVTSSSAGEWFAAAAEFGLVTGAAGAAGIAMSPGAGGGGGTAQGPQPGQVTWGSGGGGGGSQQTGGVTKLAAGGVVSSPTMFMAGDSASGGSADEAILPLSDSNAMRKIVNAIMPVMPQNAPGFGFATPAQRPPLGFDLSQPSSSERPDIHSGNPNDGDFERSEASLPRDMQGMEALRASFGGLLSTSTRRAAAGAQVQAAAAAAASMAVPAGFDQAAMEKFADRVGKQINPEGGSTGDTTHVHVAVKGMISPDNLKKVVKKINRAVQNRQTTLKASDSLRVTRRSQ
jgi:hypothetical protein